MKVNEILTEKSQLNEAFMLLGLTFPMILSAVAALIKGYTAYQLYEVLKKYDFQFDRVIRSEDLNDVLIDLIVLAVPGGGQATRAAISNAIPASLKARGSKFLADRLAPKMEELKAIRDADLVAASQLGTSVARKAGQTAAIAKYNAAAAAAHSKLNSQLKMALGLVVATPAFYVYYTNILDLEEQVKRAKAGDTTTEKFGTTDPSKIDALAWRERQKMLGELTLGVAAALGGAKAGNLIKAGNQILGNMVGGRLVGGLIKIPGNILAAMMKLGPALPLIMQTTAGKEFLKNSLVQLITTNIGKVTSVGLELTANLTGLLVQAIEEVAKKAGVDITGITGAVKSAVKPYATTQLAAPTSTAASGPAAVRVETDPANPKIMYIGGVQVTDERGFQSVGDRYLNGIKRSASALGVPDPTANIKKDPAKNYSY